jgi:hypothetical protein
MTPRRIHVSYQEWISIPTSHPVWRTGLTPVRDSYCPAQTSGMIWSNGASTSDCFGTVHGAVSTFGS